MPCMHGIRFNQSFLSEALMSQTDVLALLPLIALLAAAILVMMAAAFDRNNRSLPLAIALIGLAAGFIMLPLTVALGNPQVTPLLVMDNYSRFFMGLIFAATFAVALLAYGYLRERGDPTGEFYLLLLLAALGASVMAGSTHFASFFLGLEILSISLYALIAYERDNPLNVEAGVKYLVLAGASSAFLLFGMALVYSVSGDMSLPGLAKLRGLANGPDAGLALAGLGMMVVGIGFKLAVVPFHLWTPDVYQGAPAPVTALVATVSKGGMFALLVRYFNAMDMNVWPSLFVVFGAIAIASMLIGNLLALGQNNVKRVLAYSSIAHLGYLLVAFLARGPNGVVAVAFYLTSYFITTLAAFGVVTILSEESRQAADIEEYRGLFWRRPWSAAILSAALLSLAGIPLTSGFIGKFYIVAASVGSAQWVLAISLVVGSAIGLYYYLRIIVIMYLEVEVSEAGKLPPRAAPSLSWPAGIALGALSLGLVWLGVYPAPLINIIQGIIARV
jgi:NADH-quinone oxidoreductase subunit N